MQWHQQSLDVGSAAASGRSRDASRPRARRWSASPRTASALPSRASRVALVRSTSSNPVPVRLHAQPHPPPPQTRPGARCTRSGGPERARLRRVASFSPARPAPSLTRCLLSLPVLVRRHRRESVATTAEHASAPARHRQRQLAGVSRAGRGEQSTRGADAAFEPPHVRADASREGARDAECTRPSRPTRPTRPDGGPGVWPRQLRVLIF